MMRVLNIFPQQWFLLSRHVKVSYFLMNNDEREKGTVRDSAVAVIAEKTFPMAIF